MPWTRSVPQRRRMEMEMVVGIVGGRVFEGKCPKCAKEPIVPKVMVEYCRSEKDPSATRLRGMDIFHYYGQSKFVLSILNDGV